MNHQKIIKFGVIGCGLMGKEFASAVARWAHLTNINVKPVIVAVCDTNKNAMTWFEKNIPTVQFKTTNYQDLLNLKEIDAIYCAVPHYLHRQLYIDIINAKKHLLGEKPFGMNMQDNLAIVNAAKQNPDVVVRCSSEFPFFPGAYKAIELIRNDFIGEIIDAEFGFWHSSDLNPDKPINWKRKQETNGEYGCMGDLGMHVVHIPLRLGWKPKTVYAQLSNLIRERKDENGNLVPCDTWDNAILLTKTFMDGISFPMTLSFKRISPGNANTWFFTINGLKGSIQYSTKNPKQLRTLSYTPGQDQAWSTIDVEYQSAYSTITGKIFEFGFSDSILQMWAAFCDEIANGPNMSQPFYCATLEETTYSHKLFTAALKSYKENSAISIS